MKDKVTVAGASGFAGWLAGAASKPEHIAAVGVWFQANFGSVGFISFFFNLVFLVSIAWMVDYFSKRDDQKRADVLGLVTRVENIVTASHNSIDRLKESLHQLQLAFAKGGIYVESAQKSSGQG